MCVNKYFRVWGYLIKIGYLCNKKKDMNKQEELFKKYDVDEYGVVVNIVSGKVVPHQINKKGYHRICVWLCGKVYNFRVSRMVALKYHPNPMGLPEVNHKDADKGNNHWLNLEWCSGEDNRSHAKKTGLMQYGENHRCARLKEVDVIEIRRRIGAGESFKKVWCSYSDKIAWWGFREICRGNTWQSVAV